MNDIEVSSIDLVEGGNVFKQGHYLTLGYVPRDEKGETVDLSGKTLNVSLWGRKGVVFESAATYSGGVIRFTFDKLVAAGDYTVEFTATSSTDAKYRKKFPTNQHSGRIAIKQSADDLGVVGIQVYTVAQLKAEQKALLDAAVSGFTVDSETKMARVSGTTTHPTIGARLEADKQVLTQQLAEKVGGALKAELENLSPTVLSAIEGGEGTSFNLLSIPQNKSVTPEKTDFLSVVSNNLVDMTKVLTGHTISGSTGLPYVNGNTNLLGTYPVKPSTNYTFKFVSNYGFYRADNSFISTFSSNVDATVTVTTPADCSYMKLVYYPSKPLVQLNEGSTLLAYDTFKIRLADKIEQLSTTEIAKVKTIDTIKAKQDTIFGSVITQPADVASVTKVNMTLTQTNESYGYKRLEQQHGWFYKPLTKRMRFKERPSNYGHIVIAASNTNALYLIYKGASAGRLVNANFLTGEVLQQNFADVSPYTSTENDELLVTFDSYVLSIKIKKAGTDDYVDYLTMNLLNHKTLIDGFNKGLGILTLTSGGIYNLEYNFVESLETKTDILFKKMYTDASTSLDGAFSSSTWTAMGDSITAWDSTVSAVFGTNYRDNVKQLLNIGTVNNRGIGSTMIARKAGYEFETSSFVARYANSLPLASDIITVFGGTNDYFGAGKDGVPLGVNGSVDEFTFYGALRVLIEGLVTRYPDRKVAFFTPIYRTNHNTPNTQGHVLKDYVDAIKIVCGEYGIPVLDLFRESGINIKNNVTLLADGLHPNGTGQMFMSRKIAKFIDRL